MYSSYGKYILRGDIHHDAWKVSGVKAKIHTNTILSFMPDGPSYPLKKVGEVG